LKPLEYLRQPYPFADNDRSASEKIRRSFLIGLFIAVFLIVFQPFGISSWKAPYKEVYLSGFGLVTFLCLLLMRFAVVGNLPGVFDEARWTIGKEILLNLAFLLLVTSGNFVYLFLIGVTGLSFAHFVWNFLTVVCIGVFPLIFGIISNYRRELRKYASLIPVARQQAVEQNIVLTAENGKDQMAITTRDLLFIESADNYSKLVFVNGKSELLRSSLSRLESQLNTTKLVRCHRSYIANLNWVEKVSGNAQGYKLHLTHTDFQVPVARKYADVVQQLK
jgi:hypothetical protein